MRFRCVQIILLLFPVIALAQKADPDPKPNRNHIMLELGGAGTFGSVNYEYLLASSPENKFLLRVGFLTFRNKTLPDEKHYSRMYLVPVGFTYLYGKNKGHLELALNHTLL